MNNEIGIQSRVVQEAKVYNLDEGMDLTGKAPVSNKDGRYDIPGFKETTNFRPNYSNKKKKKSKGPIDYLKEISSFGMDYSGMLVKNMKAMPADPGLLSSQERDMNQNLLSRYKWKEKANEDKTFYEKDFGTKRESLRKFAMQPELEDILDVMSNECIVYNGKLTYFAEPSIDIQSIVDLDKKVGEEITQCVSKTFKRLYTSLQWRTRAWDDFKRFLIEGILAWEIVYDDIKNPKEILGLVALDPNTLTRKYVPETNTVEWHQFDKVLGKERTLQDSQVVYIAYQETNVISRTSYLERLIRPFNLYRIIEQAQLIWTVTNSSYKMMFTIPIKGMNKTNGMQTLAQSMNRYGEDIKFIEDSGEISINGKKNMPFNKEYWMPENEAGTPQIETLGGDGPDLNDNDQLKYFKNQLYKISKIPQSRFDQESGETWFGADPTSVARTEIDFARFVQKMRNTFSMIMLKPIRIQLGLSIEGIKDSPEIMDAISLEYNSYNLFEELMEMELMEKRVEFINNMKDSLVDMDADGNDIKFFSSEFLVRKYLKLSDAELDLNNKLKTKEMEELKAIEGSEDEEDA